MSIKENTDNNSNFQENPTVQDVFNVFNPLVKNAQYIANHPYVQAEINKAAREEYSKKIEAYNELAFNLNNKEIESLIWSIHSGKNTFEDLKKVVPGFNSSTLCLYLLETPKLRYKSEGLLQKINKISSLNVKRAHYFQLEKIPNEFYAPYEFEPTDSFILTITAENLIYQLEKERYMQEIAEKSLAIAKASLKQSEESTKYGKYAAILALVGIIVTFYLSKF